MDSNLAGKLKPLDLSYDFANQVDSPDGQWKYKKSFRRLEKYSRNIKNSILSPRTMKSTLNNYIGTSNGLDIINVKRLDTPSVPYLASRHNIFL